MFEWIDEFKRQSLKSRWLQFRLADDSTWGKLCRIWHTGRKKPLQLVFKHEVFLGKILNSNILRLWLEGTGNGRHIFGKKLHGILQQSFSGGHQIQLSFRIAMKEPENTFTRNAKSSLYSTTNREYGSPWVYGNVRAEQVNLKTDNIPTYSEIVDSMNDFRKAQRLIKSKMVREQLQREGIDPNSDNYKFEKKTQFHVKGDGYSYPAPGINVGPSIYRTNNMNYGASTPAQFEIQSKYFPCNSTFTKAFTGGAFKFNGLNTIKTVSNVHNALNDL